METIACPIDGGSVPKRLFVKHDYGREVSNVICPQCGLVFINPRMSQEGYAEFYRDSFLGAEHPEVRLDHGEAIKKRMQKKEGVLNYFIDFVPNAGKVLEVGAGYGELLFLVRQKKNAIVTGIEPSDEYRSEGTKRLGLPMHAGTLEEFARSYPEEKFDVIILYHVFEHILQPIEVMRMMKRMLNPRGVIFIEVPNILGIAVPVRDFFKLPHVFSYSPATLVHIANKSGLKVLKINNPHNPRIDLVLTHDEDSRFAVTRWEDCLGSNAFAVRYHVGMRRLRDLLKSLLKRI